MNKILQAFLPHADESTLTPLGEGIINTTYCVTDADGKRYVIQKINTAVFKNPKEVMRNTVCVTDWVRNRLREEGKGNRPVLTFVQNADGDFLYETEDGEFWRCSELIEGATAHVHVTETKLLYEAAKGYGDFVRLTDGYPAQTLAEVLPDFHNTAKRYEAFLRSVEEDVAGRAKDVEKEINYLKSFESMAGQVVEMIEKGVLPLRVTHNDTKLSNVLLDDATGEAVCVIDLDTVMPGTVLYDFGDAIRSGAASAAEDEPNLDKVNFLPERYRAFRDGFLEVCGDILTDVEKDNLVLGAKIIIFEQAIRFLTDHLNGDTYYKTAFPGHNLVRTRTQIRILAQLVMMEDLL